MENTGTLEVYTGDKETKISDIREVAQSRPTTGLAKETWISVQCYLPQHEKTSWKRINMN